MAKDDDVWTFEKGARLYTEREQRSRSLLEQVDRLDAKISAAGAQKDLIAELEREKKSVRQEFAKHLGDQIYVDPSDSRTVLAIWLISGVPSKKYREQAKAWMEQSGIPWNGSAPSLRHAVRTALDKGNKSVPEHRFGLHVERTVDIQLPRAFTVNLLGKPHHVVAAAGGPTKAELREDRAIQRAFRGEN